MRIPVNFELLFFFRYEAEKNADTNNIDGAPENEETVTESRY